jgi:hypothetical protein
VQQQQQQQQQTVQQVLLAYLHDVYFISGSRSKPR